MNEREIFLKAIEILDPDARCRFLDMECHGDSQLRNRLQGLLTADSSDTCHMKVPSSDQVVSRDPIRPDDSGTLTVGPKSRDPLHDHESVATAAHSDKCNSEISLSFLEPSLNSSSLGRLGTYEIQSIIGRGAFGVVLKGLDDVLQRVVAIKVLLPELASTFAARKRFLREARASAAIRHESIVQVYAVGEQPIPYLVMEFIPGQTLQQRIDQHGALDLDDVLQLGEQIANGLCAAHAMGLIHRDIKPSNILLETDRNVCVKVTDFGLARSADDASLTQSGFVAGTPMYMSPEQASGGYISQASDLFSLGSVLYVMTCGRPPFRAPTILAVMKRVADDTPRPIQEILPSVPIWWCQIISKLHAKRPEDRFGSAKEVSDLLKQCQIDLQKGTTPSIPNESTVKKQEHTLKSQKSKPRLMAIVAIVVLATIAVSLFHFWPPQTDKVISRTVTQRPNAMDFSEDTIELGPLLDSNLVADGRFSDASFSGDLLTLDATDQSPNLWLDFHTTEGDEVTVQTSLRIVTPNQDGFAKLVFLTNHKTETFAQIGNQQGHFFAMIKHWNDSQLPNEAVEGIPAISSDQWIDFQFVVDRQRFSLFLDGKLVTQMPRENTYPGFVSIACLGWKCEMKRPRAIVKKSEKPSE